MLDAPPRAYALDWDPSHLGDDFEDATLVKFAGWETTRSLPRSAFAAIPGSVYFEANLRTLRTIDFPINDVQWPIVSRRMLDVLRTIDPGFQPRVFPITMLDDTVSSHHRRDASGAYRPDVQVHDFVALGLEAIGFEAESSVDERAEPLLVRFESGATSFIRVSSHARRALEAAGIAGLSFRDIEPIR